LLPKRGDKPEWQHNQDYWSEKDQIPAIDTSGMRPSSTNKAPREGHFPAQDQTTARARRSAIACAL
jgi:hypothetical protein